MSVPAQVSAPWRAVRAGGLVACAVALLALAPHPTRAQPATLQAGGLTEPPATQSTIVDEGVFIISQNGKQVRVEKFAFERRSDSLVVQAASTISAPGQPERPVDKGMLLIVGALDYAMGSYRSQQITGPDTLRRGIDVAPGDTVFTLWRELNNAGTGDQLVMPPGRLYILDPPLFTTFDFIGRTLQGKDCDRRPIQVFVLGPRDSLVDATVTDIGRETLRWGGRPVVARKLVIADEQTAFTTWVSPDGRMLKLEQPLAGIRVDRRPPPLKRPGPRTK
jgi:hypothetical protein